MNDTRNTEKPAASFFAPILLCTGGRIKGKLRYYVKFPFPLCKKLFLF